MGNTLQKHHILKSYRNNFVDLLKTFEEFALLFVPRNENNQANSLAFAARTSLTQFETKQCTTQIKFRPVVPDNKKYWQVFDGDKQIEDFMQFRNEFELPSSDSDYETNCPSEENFLDEEEKSPQLADVNILSGKIENTTDMIA